MGTSLIRSNNFRNDNLPTRSDFFHPFESYFDKIFDEFFSDSTKTGVKARAGYPKMDVIQQNGKFTVEAAVPGLQAEDITVEILPKNDKCNYFPGESQTVLKISGKQLQEESRHDKNYHVKELRRSQFERYVSLPDSVEGEPEATLKNGILTLSWNCAEEVMPVKKTVPIKKLE